MTNQDSDFKYFLDHYDEILSIYPESFVVISDNKVIGSAESFEKALNTTLEKGLSPESFIIQECRRNGRPYTQKFHSRVVF